MKTNRYTLIRSVGNLYVSVQKYGTTLAVVMSLQTVQCTCCALCIPFVCICSFAALSHRVSAYIQMIRARVIELATSSQAKLTIAHVAQRTNSAHRKVIIYDQYLSCSVHTQTRERVCVPRIGLTMKWKSTKKAPPPKDATEVKMSDNKKQSVSVYDVFCVCVLYVYEHLCDCDLLLETGIVAKVA